ncbi:MAG TPA: PQQ-binding-like beta-propeller repeat protein, partial [Polyangia bacterium]
TTPASVTTSSPQLSTSGGTTKLYLGITGDLLQLDVTGTTFIANTNPATVAGRVSVGTSGATTRVFAGDNGHTMWAISPTNFTGTNYIWKYNTVSNVNGSSYYDTSTDTLQFGTAGGTVIVLTGAGNGGSPGTGVTLNASYPFTLNASDPITSPPLYYGGVMVVGTTLGKLYFLDRNTGVSPGVSIISEYYFGPSESVSGIAFDSNVNRFMVSTSSAAKDARLYYFDLVNDPTPTFK